MHSLVLTMRTIGRQGFSIGEVRFEPVANPSAKGLLMLVFTLAEVHGVMIARVRMRKVVAARSGVTTDTQSAEGGAPPLAGLSYEE